MLAMCGVIRTLRMRPQRIVGWQRLGVGDVEHGFGQTSGVQCLQQVRRDELCARVRRARDWPRCGSCANKDAFKTPRVESVNGNRQTSTSLRREQRFELIVAGVAAYAGNIVSGAAPSRTIEVEGDELREHRLAERAQSEHADTALARGSHR